MLQPVSLASVESEHQPGSGGGVGGGEVTAAAARPPEGPAGRRVESSIERVVGLHTGLDFYILPDL
jgi:hypothetical protein